VPELRETGGFDVIGAGAEHVSGADVVWVGGGGKNDGGDDGPIGVGFEVFEDGEAVGEGHIEIGHDEGGVRILSAVGVLALTHHVSDSLLPVVKEVNGAANAILSKGHLDHSPVGGFILNDDNSFLVSRHRPLPLGEATVNFIPVRILCKLGFVAL